MPSYVLSFRGQANRVADADQEAAWGQWFGEIGGRVSDFGHRVGRVSNLGARAVGDGQDVLAGYVVITAADFDEAADVAAGCPGLKHGGSVEVGETVETS
jgi:YCII-related domain